MVLAIFQCWYPHTFIMQPTAPLQRTASKATSKTFEVLLSRKQQVAIRTDWKMYSCIFYHHCIMVMIFQVATILSIFSTKFSLAQYRKQIKSNDIFTYATWNINLIIDFRNHTYSSIDPVTYLMCFLFRQFT